ncbi:MAG: hypothetical protein KIT87_09715 [Anaerolineae bacterium]|nr:hypothetical protein [Anaerolineae bacterium]
MEQTRLDTPAPRIETTDAVSQTLIARDAGLTAIELLLAVYPDPPPQGALTVRLYDDQGVAVAQRDYPLADLKHNAPFRFEFAPQRDSAGRTYRLAFSGPPGNPATFWATKTDAYADGQLFDQGQVQPGDLNFKTQTHLGYADLAALLVQGALNGLWLLLPLFGAFVLPGVLLVRWLAHGRPAVPQSDYSILNDPPGRLALSIGLSLAAWPLLFLALSLTPLRLNALLARLLVVALALLWVWLVGREMRGKTREAWRAAGQAWIAAHGLVSIIFTVALLLTGALRALHARGLPVSPWVDSIQHAVGVQLFVEGGRLPTTWGPTVLDAAFTYHFGFHAVTAVFTWLSGLPIATAVLLAGQVLNALVAVGAYLLTARLTGRRGAGLAALVIVGTVTLMPSYYLTWGRYTQLTGLALLPTAAVLTLDALHGRPPVRRRVLLAAIAGSGVFVTHDRVTLMYAAFVAAALVVESVAAVWERRWVAPYWLRGLLTGGLILLLTAPWTVRLALNLIPTGALGAWFAAPASFNQPHWELLALRYDRQLILLTALGAILSVLGSVMRQFKLAIPLWTRPRLVFIMGLAVGLTLVATNPTALGLNNSWVFTNDSLIITAFLPLAIMAGYALAAVMELVVWPLPRAAQRVVNGLAGVVLIAVALYTADGMLGVVNPVTVLVTRDDVRAAEWLRANTPPTARFLINARAWQEGSYAATDGGGWLPILADRAVTLPPVSYAYAGTPSILDRVIHIGSATAQATRVEDVLPLIAEEGVTHVYIGAKGGALRPDMFLGRPDFRQLYSNGAVWVFEVVRP